MGEKRVCPHLISLTSFVSTIFFFPPKKLAFSAGISKKEHNFQTHFPISLTFPSTSETLKIVQLRLQEGKWEVLRGKKKKGLNLNFPKSRKKPPLINYVVLAEEEEKIDANKSGISSLSLVA